MAERAERELRAIVARYAAAEAEVVREFFAHPHTPDEYLDVVLRQAGREIHPSYQCTRALYMVEHLEESVSRYALHDQVERIAEEIGHYIIMAELAEELAGRKLGREELLKYWVYAVYDPLVSDDKFYNRLLPAANRQIEVTRELMDYFGWDRGRPLTRLGEGGGGGAFAEAARHGADDFQQRFAAGMGRILSEEIEHGPNQVQGYVATFVRGEQDLAEAKHWLTRFLSQHARVRNEMYIYPLSSVRLAAIDAGDIEPMVVTATGR